MAYNDKKGGRPPKNLTIMTPSKIKMAIKSTQSMGQAALYMGVSKNTFKKYAKQYDLWNPMTERVKSGELKNMKGIRRIGNVGQMLKHDVKAILEGRNPNPFRENTLLEKAIREGYMKCQCNNCKSDFSHMIGEKEPPLILDFLDRDTQNTNVSNLRALCFNCIYSLSYTKKGWYRHRDTPIGYGLDEANTGRIQKEIKKDPKYSGLEKSDTSGTVAKPSKTVENTVEPREEPIAVPQDTEIEYIPFEEFQKML